MHHSSPAIARAQLKRSRKLQDGTVLSFTVLAHPPAEFGNRPRTIALIELQDGSRVLAPVSAARIGMRVRPRMSLSCVTEQKLRVYDVAYEEIVGAREPSAKPFPGYILALSGPSGVGKTTVRNLLIHMFADYVSTVPLVTTRPRDKKERGEFRHVSKKVFEQQLQRGEIVAVIKRADDEGWDGYRASDIAAIWETGKLPVVTADVHLLDGLATHYSRRSILSFGLLPPGKSKRVMLSNLLHRLRQGSVSEEWVQDRMKSAEREMALFSERQDLFDRVIVNHDSAAVVELLRKHVPGLS